MPFPLEGVRVLELARVLAGPYCGMVLGDLGAEVIKVERPALGDDLRSWGPPFTADGESTYFLSVNRNKRSIALDLKSPDDLEIVKDLVRVSDVVLENFKPGGMERLGLGPSVLASLNPSLVHCSITAYGTAGPMRDEPGYDVIVQALGGLMSVTGYPDGPPTRVGVAIVDIATGLNAAIAVLAALRVRQATGAGQRVDLSLLGVELASMPNLTAGYLVEGVVPRRRGNGHPNAAPYGVFPTADGEIVLAIGNDDQWRRLCEALDRPHLATDPKWARNGSRQNNNPELETMLAGWFGNWTTEALTARLKAFDVPIGPLRTVGEALESEQARALDAVVEVDGPALRLVGSPLRFAGEQPRPARRPPRLDEDREHVLQSVLGRSGGDTPAAPVAAPLE
jgi:crotonobetainyl-CoA:carnitine CoA-transferase CaiB-like acyl-CoA transferase